MFEKNLNMKTLIITIGLTATVIITSCDVLDEAANIVLTEDGSSKPALTNEEVIAGLKEALNVGIKNSVDVTAVTDGFLKNPEIRLPWPEDALQVREKAMEWGLESKVDKFETTLNRAAEEASKEALPIFKDAIVNMSISDGFAILKGGDGAATQYLKDNTTASLKNAFRPKVKEAISKVKLTDYWNPIMTKYNAYASLSGKDKINPDLDEYVLDKAVAGLFHMVEKEENKIRENPGARVTELLQKVFGSVGN